MKIRTLLAIEALLLLASCTPKADMPMGVESPIVSSGRVQVTRIGVFTDTIAYQSTRGVYEIVDTKTNKEFIGISGIGITEVGSHKSGKTSSSDER